MIIFSRFIRHICIVISWLVVSLSVQAETTLEVIKNSRLDLNVSILLCQ